MMIYKSKKAILSATVALSGLVISAAVGADAIAQTSIEYTGTLEEYNALQPAANLGDKVVKPDADISQSGNQITISNPAPGTPFYAPSSVTGGHLALDDSESITIDDNRVEILGGTLNSVYGGAGINLSSGDVTLEGNSVSMSGGDVKGAIYGGFATTAGSANLVGNSIAISGGLAGGDGNNSIYGSYSSGSGNSNLANNSVTISGGSARGIIYGASSSSSGTVNIESNSVVITGGQTSIVFGGHGDSDSDDDLTITNNSVTISGNASTGAVTGGRSSTTTGAGIATGDTTVSYNRVTISGNAETGVVTGGSIFNNRDGDKNVEGNIVTISGGTIYGEVMGGYVLGSTATAKGNSVLVSGGIIRSSVSGSRLLGSGTISGNNVTILSGNLTGDINGGWGNLSASLNPTMTVTGNSAAISGGTINGNIYGGYGISNTVSNNAAVNTTDNLVSISGGTIVGDVYGGYGASIGTGNISGNKITISGGSITGNIYGGYGNAFFSGDVTTTDNIVTLENSAIVNGVIYGGYAVNATNNSEITDFEKVVAGNTLNLNGYSGSVAGIRNFENYNWILPKTVVDGNILIKVTGDTPTDLTGTTHTVAMENDGNRLNVGDKVIMIDKATGDSVSTPTHVTQGQFIIYDVNMGIDDTDQLVLLIDGKRDGEEGGEINPRTKAFLEGRAGALRFVSQGSDLIATAGIENIRMMAALNNDNKNPLSLSPFLIMQGASERTRTGSHVDIDGFNMAAGIASGFALERGHKVTLGAFFEYGRGTYDTYNSFTGYDDVRGNGDTHYSGGGLFGRLDFAETGLGRVSTLAPTQADGLYLEASFRAGRASLGFNSADLTDAEGYRGNYDSKSNYVGGHVSAGYVFNFDELQALDIYGRYLWTRMGGDTVTVGKDKMHFDRSMSARMQLGGRYNYAYSDQFKPYIGVAYEYEFKGDIGATAYNMRLDEPSLKGGTGIFEAGFSFIPNAQTPDLSINLNAQAFIGQRQGGSGQVKLKYQF